MEILDINIMATKKHDQPTVKFPSFIIAADAIAAHESDHDIDEVDTTLTLSTPGSRNPTPPPPPIINNNIPNSQVSDVDTALTLSITPEKSINLAVICSPTPIRCFHPNYFPEPSSSSSSSSSSSTALNLAGPSRTNNVNRATPLKRKRAVVNGDVKKIKRSRTNGEDEGDRHRPLLPTVREFPALMQALESENRTGAVFLYRKKLKSSDVREDLNRLFVTRREWLLSFLTAEEAAAVDDTKKGVKVLGLDQAGKSYSLVLKSWKSLNVTVINGADWNKITAANGAVKDDFIEIWGFRQYGKLGFALIFGRPSLPHLLPLVI